jgi:hypothetical protein
VRSFFAKRPEDRGHQLAHSSRLGLCRRIIVKVPLQYEHFLRWLVISPVDVGYLGLCTPRSAAEALRAMGYLTFCYFNHNLAI